MKSNFIKILIIVLALGQLALFPALASADLLGIQGSNPATPLYVNNTVNPIYAVPMAAIAAAQTANAACETTEHAFSIGDTSAQLGFGGLTLISGGANILAQTTAKIAKIDGFISCHQAVLNTLSSIPTPDLVTTQQKQTVVNSAAADINSLKTKEESLKAQLTIAQQGFWKTLVYNILIKTTQSVTTRLVGQLVSNYKIQDFEKYAGAVATQVYDNEYIQQNANGSAADQLILRSMLTNPIAQSVIQPSVYQRSSNNLGFNPAAVDYSSNNQNFYVQMASIAAPPNDPFVQQMVLADKAQQAHSQAMTTSQAEIAQSNGLKTPRTCGATLQQQKSIDLSYKAANDQVANRQALLNTLVSNPNSKPADIAKAQSDLNAAIKNLQNVPNDNLDAAGNAAIDICTAIVSPPSLINAGINDALKQFDQSLGTYNNNNLPFFINAITSVATQLTNNLIFGGNQSSATILKENTGALATGAAITANFVSSETQVQQNNNLSVTASRTDDGTNKSQAMYSLQWDASSVSGANSVSITGPGLPANMSGLLQSNLSAAIAATVAVPGNYKYTITAYGNSKADVKATVTITITPTQVAGAYVARPLESIRGPLGTETAAISPRGSEE